MNVQGGSEWVVDAYGCDPDALRSIPRLQALVNAIVAEMRLRPVATPLWHQFPGPAGVTGVVVLSESHLTCHTFPEQGYAALNLYCCRPRAPWPWETRLRDALGAREVRVTELQRGERT
ncbi:MAG TPA: adenosylmethionine decarboxylase [Vicinamibacterales bacterium]